MNGKTIYDNYEELTNHGNVQERKVALSIAEAGIQSVIPYVRTKEYVSLRGTVLKIADKTFNLEKIKHIYVVGVGKGSYPIAQALDEILGERISEGFLIVKEGEKRKLKHITVFESSHPFPDERSVVGAKAIMAIADKAGKDDLVFAAVTGGSSALANLPAGNVSIYDMQATSKLLLQCGADIVQMNAVRRHLCNLKGGKLLQHAQPAMMITFTLDTNTPGMPWPDLCLPDPSSFQDAIDVLKKFGLWDKVPASVRERLLDGEIHPEEETLKSLEGMQQALYSVGNQRIACTAAAKKAEELGYKPLVLSSCIDGEAKDVGIVLAGMTNAILAGENYTIQPPCALICGGETTISIIGTPEKGGPNQESVFGFSKKIRQQDHMAFVCIDTDGTDGPTDMAGGIADGYSKNEMKKLGIDYQDIFQKHGTYDALNRLHDGIYTGNTGTNVMNLRIVVITKLEGK
ncbi:MAG: DUF4147 domain-containing protein [Sphaerochaetaceae bacterium]|nr:DUF4147 domain-containing protein [Sphaerochaetaceae bacterium]